MLLHKEVEATATPTIDEKGTAMLLVAAYTLDRGGDVIQRGAFRDTIAAWRATNKQLPLAWNHETDEPERLIGTVNPDSMRETRDGLLAEAHLDLDGSSTAREVWRLVKSDSIGVSFGYLVKDQEDAGDGKRLLKSIDLYEISLTATPMHGSTRVVSWKSSETGTSTSTDAEWEILQSSVRVADQAREEEERKREEQERKVKEIEEIAAKVKAEEAKAAKKARPIKVKTFRV